ncbi:hypothetical protein L6164_025249 [Bauhinia variegata]|uniref:Uncharacterized protein n=1 Tax=Bauhinia variegata TaxID=167791 RepID=A0ACB9M003_BAUVA|nr:hypothetical protein L6164_025249 [Bauhinia variegata]
MLFMIPSKEMKKLLHLQISGNPTLVGPSTISPSYSLKHGFVKFTQSFLITKASREAWLKLSPPPNFFNSSLEDWLYSSISGDTLVTVSVPWSFIFSFMSWVLWKDRNNTVFCNPNTIQQAPHVRAMALASEFYHLVGVQKTKVFDTILITWNPLPHNYFKLNCDASGFGNPGNISFWGVIRDASGSWVQEYSGNLLHNTVNYGEIWSIHIGIKLALALKVDHVIVESDSLIAVNALKYSNPQPFHQWKTLLVYVCTEQIKQFSCCLVQHTCHERNQSG